MSHPDAKLTLRQAYDKHYFKDELSKSALTIFECHLKNWEKFTANPPIGEADNQTVEQFRQGMLDAGYAATSINSTWKHVRSIFRRVGPVMDKNPWALEIISRVPAMRPVPVERKIPRRVDQHDLTLLYVACRQADYPRVGYEPADWWRTLLVLCYFTGLRRGDLARLKWSQIDFAKRTLQFAARKTHKHAVIPLHDAAVAHLERIKRTGGLVFPGLVSSGGRFYIRFHKLQESAEVSARFTMHDIRRTAASEIERIRPGMAAVLLQHSQKDVTHAAYLNEHEELAEAIGKMRVPTGFNAGPKMSDREATKLRQERFRLHPEDFRPIVVEVDRWRFFPGGFEYDGKPYRLGVSALLRLLQRLVTAGSPVDWEDCLKALGWRTTGKDPRHRVHVGTHRLRQELRKLFGLSDNVDPVPCVSRGRGGAWTIFMPPYVDGQKEDDAKGGAA